MHNSLNDGFFTQKGHLECWGHWWEEARNYDYEFPTDPHEWLYEMSLAKERVNESGIPAY